MLFNNIAKTSKVAYSSFINPQTIQGHNSTFLSKILSVYQFFLAFCPCKS